MKFFYSVIILVFSLTASANQYSQTKCKDLVRTVHQMQKFTDTIMASDVFILSHFSKEVSQIDSNSLSTRDLTPFLEDAKNVANFGDNRAEQQKELSYTEPELNERILQCLATGK